ncbi:PI-actitoxin-Aeq3b-like [Rhipicephalus microplus]|uniref:PI-actitoxin-Aeq3b n=1 Tax=Rhipicephalus microplus TaxID=6941 RepID=UPI003F6AC13D
MNAAMIFCLLTIVFSAMASAQVDVKDWYHGVDFQAGCRPAPVTGLCKASFVRWYFDVTAGECKQFIYGGCGGNQNRYETMRECEIACLR